MTKDGLLMNGTNGIQLWDTCFSIQAAAECGTIRIIVGLVHQPKYASILSKAFEFLKVTQVILLFSTDKRKSS